jgi:hypothetical protein
MNDFCDVRIKEIQNRAILQVNSLYLQVPYLSYVNQGQVSLTETPNEYRYIPYAADGRGLNDLIEKWCVASWGSLFLAMAERVTRVFGYVFKNKCKYGTAIIASRKVKFTPVGHQGDVKVEVSGNSTVTIMWKNVAGVDHFVRMSWLLFGNLASESFD